EHATGRYGSDQRHSQTADRVVVEAAAHRVGDDHYREKCDACGENQAVKKNDGSGFLEVWKFRVLNLPVNLGHGFFAAHGKNRMAQSNQNANETNFVGKRRVTKPPERAPMFPGQVGDISEVGP